MRRYKVPGRINLIGEHTDYNQGFVLPGAVDQHLIFELERHEDPNFQFYSAHFEQEDHCDAFGNGAQYKWSKFFCQLIRLMTERKYAIEPIKCSFHGNLPIGAGMSSSSALSCGLIYAINDLFDLRISRREMVFLASEAENSSGVDGGKMDQYSILFGEENCLLKIDCRDYTHQLVPIYLQDYSIVLMDTKVAHELVNTDYNERHAECKQGLNTLRKEDTNLNSVRDITCEILKEHQEDLDPTIHKRLRYVLDENYRVEGLVKALENRNLNRVGELMYQSHEGLQNEYEVSCKELDYIVDWTRQYDEVLGARMMGGGFGGCVIALVENAYLKTLTEDLKVDYKKEFGFNPSSYQVRLSQGVQRIL